jgi:septal ring factor EnvC (AmiA/AmiB activator)
MSRLTSHEIETKIAAAKAEVSRLERKARSLSFDVVSGVDGAAEAFQATDDRIKEAQAEIELLDGALETAWSLERADEQTRQQAQRVRMVDDARAAAGAIIEKAKRLDEVAAEFLSLADEIADLEDEARRKVRLAGLLERLVHPNKQGAARLAFNNLDRCMTGPAFHRQQQESAHRRTSEAWGFLMTEDIYDDL